MKKIFYSIITTLAFYGNAFAAENKSTGYKSEILPANSDNTIIKITGNPNDWTSVLWEIAKYITDTLFWILITIWTWVFLYLGAKLIMARGNPEEFRKNLMWLVYALLWIVVMTVAYAVVWFVSSISF